MTEATVFRGLGPIHPRLSRGARKRTEKAKAPDVRRLSCKRATGLGELATSEDRVSGRSSHRRPSAWEASRQRPDSYGIRRGYGRSHTILVGAPLARIRIPEGQTRTETRTRASYQVSRTVGERYRSEEEAW